MMFEDTSHQPLCFLGYEGPGSPGSREGNFHIQISVPGGLQTSRWVGVGLSQGDNLRPQLLEVAEAPPCQLHWAAVGKLLTVPSVDPGPRKTSLCASKARSWMTLGYRCVLTASIYTCTNARVYIYIYIQMCIVCVYMYVRRSTVCVANIHAHL